MKKTVDESCDTTSDAEKSIFNLDDHYDMGFDLKFDNTIYTNCFFADASSDRVGIGTASPRVRLDSAGLIDNKFWDDLESKL